MRFFFNLITLNFLCYFDWNNEKLSLIESWRPTTSSCVWHPRVMAWQRLEEIGHYLTVSFYSAFHFHGPKLLKTRYSHEINLYLSPFVIQACRHINSSRTLKIVIGAHPRLTSVDARHSMKPIQGHVAKTLRLAQAPMYWTVALLYMHKLRNCRLRHYQ